MSDFTPKQERIIRLKVEHQLKGDAIRENIKNETNELFEKLSNYVDKNFEKFSKDPKAVFKAFALKYMKQNDGLFDEALNEGEKYIRNIIET